MRGHIARRAKHSKFSVAKREHHRTSEPHSDDLRLARKFADAASAKLGDLLTSAVLFGSCATGSAHEASDIDVLLIVDDVRHTITDTVTQSYQDVVSGLAAKISSRLHLNTLRLSNFFEYCREGDPVVVNMLRDGVILHDNGFFSPAQMLLQQGRIRPSREAIWTYYARPANTLKSARKHILSACVDLYWAGIDSAHAALMSVGQVPPSPEHVPEMVDRLLAQKGLVPKGVPRILHELYQLQKGITHRDIKEVTGSQYDAYLNETLKAVDALRTVVERQPPGV